MPQTAEIWFVPLPQDGAGYRCTTVTQDSRGILRTCNDEAVTGLSMASYNLVNSVVLPTVVSTMRAVCQKHADLIKQEVEAL